MPPKKTAGVKTGGHLAEAAYGDGLYILQSQILDGALATTTSEGRKLSGCAPKFTASAAKFVSCKRRGSPQPRQKRSWSECLTRSMSFVPNATSSKKVSLGQPKAKS